MRSMTHNMRANLSILEKNHSGLEEKNASIEKLITSHTQTLSTLEELTRLGLGMRELLIIRSTIIEAAKANGLNDNLAWKKFFGDLGTYNAKLGFEREIQIQRNQLKHLLFLNNNLSEHLGILVADSFQTKMGQEQKLSLASILDSQPDIGEMAAAQMEQRTINKKKENADSCVRGYTHEVKTGDIAGLDPKVTAKQQSRSIFSPTDLGKSRAAEQFDLSDTEFEKKRYDAANAEIRRMAWLQTHSE